MLWVDITITESKQEWNKKYTVIVGMLITKVQKTGVHHHDLALPGYQGKDRLVAVPALSAVWFPWTKTRWQVLFTASFTCPQLQDNVRKQWHKNPWKQGRPCHTAPLYHSWWLLEPMTLLLTSPLNSSGLCSSWHPDPQIPEGMFLSFVSSHAYFSFQSQLLGSPCHARNRDGFCPQIP